MNNFERLPITLHNDGCEIRCKKDGTIFTKVENVDSSYDLNPSYHRFDGTCSCAHIDRWKGHNYPYNLYEFTHRGIHNMPRGSIYDTRRRRTLNVIAIM